MKLTRVRVVIGVVALAVVAIAAPLAVLAGPDEPGVSDETRRVLPPELGGLTVIEAHGGDTQYEAVTVDWLRHGPVVLPKAYGIFAERVYDAPDLDLVVILPGGTRILFFDKAGAVEVLAKSAADASLIKQILSSAPAFKVRPNQVTGELP